VIPSTIFIACLKIKSFSFYFQMPLPTLHAKTLRILVSFLFAHHYISITSWQTLHVLGLNHNFFAYFLIITQCSGLVFNHNLWCQTYTSLFSFQHPYFILLLRCNLFVHVPMKLLGF